MTDEELRKFARAFANDEQVRHAFGAIVKKGVNDAFGDVGLPIDTQENRNQTRDKIGGMLRLYKRVDQFSNYIIIAFLGIAFYALMIGLGVHPQFLGGIPK